MFTNKYEGSSHNNSETLGTALSATSFDHTLQPVKKIQIEKNTRLLSVDMDEEPGKVVICEQGEKVLLFTQGVGPCFAIMLSCRLKSGQTIIALGHSYWEEMPYHYEVGLLGNVNEIIAQNQFKPSKFIGLLEKVKSYSNGEPIDVYLASGDGNTFTGLIREQLYNEYIKTLQKVYLKGSLMNPYGLNEAMRVRLDLNRWDAFLAYSITAGITADGTPIVCKKYDINFDIEKFPNQPALIKYLEKSNIDYKKSPATFECFENQVELEKNTSKPPFTNDGGFVYWPIPLKKQNLVQEVKLETTASEQKGAPLLAANKTNISGNGSTSKLVDYGTKLQSGKGRLWSFNKPNSSSVEEDNEVRSNQVYRR